MHDIWENDEQIIAVKWDEIYKKKYIEHLANNGIGRESQVKAVGKAYEHACLEIIKVYNINMSKLDKILNSYSTVLNKKSPETKTRK